MIPSSLTGVLAFLLILGPGYVFVRRIEVLEALYRVSPFRETVSIVFASLSCNLGALLLFGIVRIVFPSITPDIGALVRQGQSYWAADYGRINAYGLVVYGVALAIAFVASHPKVRGAGFWDNKLIRGIVGAPVLDSRSAWSRLFGVADDTIVRVACEFDDGSWVDGWVYDWNAQPEEDADRSIVLHAPIRARASGADATVHLVGIGYTLISQSRIVRLDVTHVEAQNRAQFNAVYTTSS